MPEANAAEIEQAKTAYHAAIEEWIAAIRKEEALIASISSVEELDKWEGASFDEEDIRGKVEAAKKEYEAAMRLKFYEFK